MRIRLLILPRIPRMSMPCLLTPVHPRPRPPPSKPAHRPQNAHARTTYNARRRDHECRTAHDRADRGAGDGSYSSANGRVLGVADQAPESEDEDVAGAAEEGAGAEARGLWAGLWVEYVVYGVLGFGEGGGFAGFVGRVGESIRRCCGCGHGGVSNVGRTRLWYGFLPAGHGIGCGLGFILRSSHDRGARHPLQARLHNFVGSKVLRMLSQLVEWPIQRPVLH